MRALRHRDFRLLWIGAFLSFVGSWIQNVALGALVVYKLHGDEGELGLVSFCQLAPVAVLGPFAGTLTDTTDKRSLLILAQVLLGSGAIYLSYVTHLGTVTFWDIRLVAVMFGVVGTFETPTRQAIVSRVVPPEDLAEAIPVNAMTFNMGRVLGSALGGLMLKVLGYAACFLANGISYLTLIFGVLFIRSNLKAGGRKTQPIKDLVLEGMRYTFRDPRLRLLFILESILSAFGLVYLPLMPAYVKSVLHLDEGGLGIAATTVGLGAMLALFMVSYLAKFPLKGKLVRVCMLVMGTFLILLSFTRNPYVAYAIFPVLGLCSIAQFNTTNTLFQILSPDALRGRVLSMHIWAISGLSPFANLMFGWMAKHLSVSFAYLVGGMIVLSTGLFAWFRGHALDQVDGP